MSLPNDFNKQTTVTISLLIWIAGMRFSMGMIYAKFLSNTAEHTSIREYVEQEVGGLRSDWDRDRVEQDRRLINLEK
jgi:hypothetical protein